MDVSLYQAAAAMSATARWQDLIAENLSASSVPGARKEEISFSDVQAGLASGTSDPQKAGFYIPTADQVTNFQAGELRSTGNPMDLALEGPGFFTVQMAKGKDAYTRDGEFQLNAKGQLVTKEGYAVLGQGGPLQFNPNNVGPITVSANGNVSQGDQTVGKLQTVEFGNPNQLTKHGAGFFTADSSTAQPVTSTSTQIRQGFIESANTSPTTEMASMITAMRMFEANQKVLQMQSDRMSRVITDLGSTSPAQIMLRALYSAAAGMESQQMNLDVISNNLANVNTTGYKKSKLEFQDLLYQTTRAAGSQQGGGNQLPGSLQIGQGSIPIATERVFTNGKLPQTGGNLDVAIQGAGFFQVQMPDGTLAYTRDGGFKTDSEGRVVTSDGYPVQGGFQPVPTGTTNITISASGAVTYTTSSGTTTSQIQLANFNNPGGLEALGHNLFKETQASGSAQLGDPTQSGLGELQQGYLELSNVSVVQEMVNLILAQRAYEVNSKAVQAADQMMQDSNNLQR